MHLDPITGPGEMHRSGIEPRIAESLATGASPPPDRDAEHQPEDGPNWPVILTAACYSTLALAAFAGVHQAIVIGCCYLGLAALVTQVHKRS